MAALSNARHGIACASGTDALLLPLKALDLQPGDEVIMPRRSPSLPPPAPSIMRAARRSSWTSIRPPSISIRPRSRRPSRRGPGASSPCICSARWPGDGGAPPARRAARAGPDRRRGTGDRRAAEGRRHLADGRRARHRGTLSFFPSKNLGAWGDGGMILTQDDALAERLRRLRLHGGARSTITTRLASTAGWIRLQAAVLLAKLPASGRWSVARRARAARYTEAFEGHSDDVPAPGGPGERTRSSTSTPSGRSVATSWRRISRRGIGTPSTIRSRFICSAASPTLATAPAACRPPRLRRARSSRCRSIRN